MIIKSIHYKNFRQFAQEGRITFSTDGRVSIIYGKNGDGKTTLHQLFRWIIYNHVLFNRTTNASKLYNLERGRKLTIERSMFVMGEIECEHDGRDYLIRREREYYKRSNGDIIHKAEGDQFWIKYRTDDNDWNDLDKPELFIEEAIPSGLSQYFFFDGETMIADLKVKGSDSAKILRKALYTIFDLEAYEKALLDLGKRTATQSLLGHLESKRLKALENAVKDKDMHKYLSDLRIITRKINEADNMIQQCKGDLEEKDKRIKEISELIGAEKTKKQLESLRGTLKNSIKGELKKIESRQKDFGKEIEENYSGLLMAGVVNDARERLYMQVQDESNKMLPGLTKELIIHLLKHSADGTCICGCKLEENNIQKLEEWKSFFPPSSYKSTYSKFVKQSIRYAGKYKADALSKYIVDILDAKTKIKDLEKQVDELDVQIRQTGDVDDLVLERNQLEKEVDDLKKKYEQAVRDKSYWEHQQKIRQRKVDNTKIADETAEIYQKKIDFVQKVVDEIQNEMDREIDAYSRMLEKEIGDLLKAMLTSERTVELSKDFQLQVKDSHGDESKSEGQFAVVSFSYIAGIFKVLSKHERLINKVFPLVLDGPFSKLDSEQKQNVIDTIPKFAPQVVIFSKDPLNDLFAEEKIGKIWTIDSNQEKNNAVVREGFLWN